MLAHAAGGTLPAPPWLLAYIGVALVLGTAAAMRATWPRARFTRIDPADPDDAPRVGAGHFLGLLLFIGMIVVAVMGPDSSAASLAPWAVLVVWWVGLPIVCLLAGDVFRVVNPFLPLVALLDRGRRSRPTRAAPSWTAAAFLGAWTWYLLAYHRPGSPRALAVFLVVYAIAAVAGGVTWGRAWLGAGDAFGALSTVVARMGLRRRGGTPVATGTAVVMLVWIGGTAFDGFTYTPFWQDVLGTSTGWTRTMLSTVGLVWLTAIVAGAYLVVVRVAERGLGDAERGTRLVRALGFSLAPLACGWFLGHDLTFLLAEGQNAYALMSDPFGRGWDLFGTYDHTIDYRIVHEAWVQWTQLALIAAGHIAAVVVLHELALQRLRPSAAMRATWTMAVVTSGSIVAAALLVLA